STITIPGMGGDSTFDWSTLFGGEGGTTFPGFGSGEGETMPGFGEGDVITTPAEM
ncbi:MAG: hypothetical protein HUK21_00385, partial [Fibrobacteraceae bacterium]|nr:hypothetical protein [Fibrobacteraceae bacterium]